MPHILDAQKHRHDDVDDDEKMETSTPDKSKQQLQHRQDNQGDCEKSSIMEDSIDDNDEDHHDDDCDDNDDDLSRAEDDQLAVDSAVDEGVSLTDLLRLNGLDIL